MNLTPKQMTAPVRQRDARIEMLEDLVRDLLPLAVCRCWKDVCRDDIVDRVILRAAQYGSHAIDCPLRRATSALKERTP